jgi:hypothetical protein
MVTTNPSSVTVQARIRNPGTEPLARVYADIPECDQCAWVWDGETRKFRLKYLTPLCFAGHWAKYRP